MLVVISELLSDTTSMATGQRTRRGDPHTPCESQLTLLSPPTPPGQDAPERGGSSSWVRVEISRNVEQNIPTRPI